MRKLSNGAVGVIAAAVCIFITVLTMDTDAFSMAFNLAVLAVMLVILAFSGLFGFSRTQQTIRGLDGAARKLTGIYQEKGDLEEVTAVGSQIFQVEYLDRKYQEYLAYLRRLGISYLLAGEGRLDCRLLLGKLKGLFGVGQLMVAGGGITNWSFLGEGLIDELSLVIAPVADGSAAAASIFEEADFLPAYGPEPFRLEEAKPLEGNVLWLRYLRAGSEG